MLINSKIATSLQLLAIMLTTIPSFSILLAKQIPRSASLLHKTHLKPFAVSGVHKAGKSNRIKSLGAILNDGRSISTDDSNEDDVEGEYVPTSTGFSARYNGPSQDEMTDEQREIRDAIVASRPRTGLSGPFGPWLAVPEIARPAQSLGRACRYGTSLSFRESELVILLTGAKTRSHAEFDIHVGEALKAGIPLDLIKSIPRDDNFSLQAVLEKVVPHLKGNEREIAILKYTAELLDTYSVTEQTYRMAKAALGNKDSVLVEITSIAGYYTYVAYTLNAFKIPSK